MKRTTYGVGFSLDYNESPEIDELLCESHCHSQFEMIAVVEGDITIIFEGRHYRLLKGQCALLSPLSYHTVLSNKHGNYHRVIALFDRGAIPSVLHPSFPEMQKNIYIVNFSDASTLAEICKSQDKNFYAPLAESIMVKLFYKLIRSGCTESAEQVEEELSSILEYIEEHLCENIRLSDIAAHVALSKSSVSHLFVERMKISPMQYVLQKKLAFAEKLIREGSPATEAAMTVGYENYSNFYRMYRKQFGRNPIRRIDAREL